MFLIVKHHKMEKKKHEKKENLTIKMQFLIHEHYKTKKKCNFEKEKFYHKNAVCFILQNGKKHKFKKEKKTIKTQKKKLNIKFVADYGSIHCVDIYSMVNKSHLN